MKNKKQPIRQMSIFDVKPPEAALADEPALSKLENDVKRYVYKNYRGKKNAIAMKDLANEFNISKREVRDVMANITEKSIIDFDSGANGYFACKPGELRDSHRIKRTLGSVRRIVKGNPKMLKLFFKELNMIRKEL